MPNDYYQILGIDKNASQEEIKKAYRKLAHQHHPDKGGDAKKFQKVNEAYQVLSNKEKREQYDKFGRTFEGAEGFDFGNFWHQAGVNFDFDDIGDIFEEFFGSRMRRQQAEDVRKGDDIEVGLEMELKDVLKPFVHKLNISRYESCSRCNGTGAEPGTKVKECQTCRGTGRVQQMQRSFFGAITRYTICPDCQGEGTVPEKPCNVCKGEGRVETREEIEIRIPAGVDTGQVIRFRGKGDAGRKNGQPGDLYVKILVKPHPLFQRKGDDLYLEQKITFSQAVLGGEIELPSLEDKGLIFKVPKQTDSGKVFKISNKGVPHFTGLGRGDLYIMVSIETPKTLTREQKDLIKRLKKQGM